VTSKRAPSPDAERLSAGGNGRAGELAQLPVAARPQRADAGDEAVRAFHERYPDVRFAPVLVIIPAYNEADCIGTVLPAVPRKASGLEVDTLVVDDGSADRTREVALGHGVYVAKLARNSGQGSALRVGYRLAREHGARFIVTLDADGQWDPADILPLVDPLVRDEADLVLGSRILGRAETDDSVRRAGVHVFARFLRLVTGLPITDTSTGVRAMRAEVTATVRQEEPQYQASELLIGAIYQGYRIAERPVVMRKRVAGKSKKGHNILYGFRYGRVVLRTLWRERRAAKTARTHASADLGR
jgi:glycosyltransferase involved in cell wall biosynthesis